MSKPFKILLLDDDETYHFILENVFQIVVESPQLHWVKNCKEAYDILERNEDDPYDLILIDLVLELESGWNFLETYRLEYHERFKDTAVMVNSVDFSRLAKDKANKFDFVQEFIVKPLTIETVIEFMNKSHKSFLKEAMQD